MDNDGGKDFQWQPDENQPAATDQSADQPTAEVSDTNEQVETQPETPDETQNEQSPEQESTDEEINEPEIAPVEISWTASDSIEHHRSKGWYIGIISIVVAITALLATLTFFEIFSLSTSITTEILVIVMMVALIVVTRQPAREVNYLLTDAGLTINGQLHPFSEFRAFGVRQVGAMWQLVLTPIRRFGINVSMFINEEQGEKIIDELGARLPMEDVKNDILDSLIRRLKI
ncbi:hypothetical protein FWG95_00670 [Candidatus Saccharibacteria bacterium]|nr:hypothetical protein [Candidatus Saccharibacteria bacterium]